MPTVSDIIDNQLYLGAWMLVVASLRALAVVLGYLFPKKLQENVFTKGGEGAKEGNRYSYVTGRTFAIWTVVTCLVCIVTAFNLHNNQIIALAITTFIAANTFFFIELTVYGSVTVKSIASPFIVATTSIAWLTYTLYARGALTPAAFPSLLIGDLKASPLAQALAPLVAKLPGNPAAEL